MKLLKWGERTEKKKEKILTKTISFHTGQMYNGKEKSNNNNKNLRPIYYH